MKGGSDPGLERVARRSYAVGLGASLLAAGAAQVGLRWLPEGANPPAAVQEVGYAFTGLCLLGAVLLARWGRGATRQAAGLEGAARRRATARVYGLLAIASLAGILCGFLYWGLGGRPVERHARTFLALGPLAFLALAPRPGRWTAATAG